MAPADIMSEISFILIGEAGRAFTLRASHSQQNALS